MQWKRQNGSCTRLTFKLWLCCNSFHISSRFTSLSLEHILQVASANLYPTYRQLRFVEGRFQLNLFFKTTKKIQKRMWLKKPGTPTEKLDHFHLVQPERKTKRQARAEEKALQLAVTCIRQRSSGMTALTPWISLYVSVDWGSLVLRICRVFFWDGGFWGEICWDLKKPLVFQIDDWRCWEDLRNLWVIMIENERNVHTWGLWKRGFIPWSYIIAQTLDSHEWFYMATDRASTHSFAGTQAQSFHSCMCSQEDPAWLFEGFVFDTFSLIMWATWVVGCICLCPPVDMHDIWYLNITSLMTWNYISHLWPTTAATLRKTK